MTWENKILQEVVDREFPKLKEYRENKIYWFFPYEIDTICLFSHTIGIKSLIAIVFKDFREPNGNLKVGFNKKAKEVFKSNKRDFKEILRHELLHLETLQDEGEEEFEKERAKRRIIGTAPEVKSFGKIIEAIYSA